MAGEKLQFTTNQPLQLALQAIEGVPVESNFGGMQHRFVSDRGTFYVSEAAGHAITDQLQKLGVTPGEVCEITKAEQDLGRGRKGIRWVVGLIAGEQSNGTFAVPAPKPQTAARAAAAKPAAVEPAAPPAELEGPLWASVLVAQTNLMTDAFAAAVRHAEKHGAAVTREDVRTLLVTSFIALSKKMEGSNRAAA